MTYKQAERRAVTRAKKLGVPIYIEAEVLSDGTVTRFYFMRFVMDDR